MTQPIDVYDFDYTIYDGDSSLDFYFFSLRKNWPLVRYLPYQLAHALLFGLKLEDRTQFKAGFFVFLRGIKSPDAMVEKFWMANSLKIKQWYRSLDHANDVIISASPEFLLAPMTKDLKVALIATQMNPKTGEILGLNCRGAEKVIRLKKVFKKPTVRRVYSDSLVDRPLFELAEEKYLVKKNSVERLR